MLTKLIKEEFVQVYKIMESSFPPDEHRPYEEQQKLLENPNYQIYVAKETDNSLGIQGFMAVWQLESLSFIEHFAVDSKFRNAGLGSRMLREVREHLIGRICLEVELPDNDIAKRRIEFYKRNGLYYNEYPYIQPAISRGRNTIPLRIMTFESQVDKEEFGRIKNILYRDVYKIQEWHVNNKKHM